MYVDHWFQRRFNEVLSEKVTPRHQVRVYVRVYVVRVLQTPHIALGSTVHEVIDWSAMSKGENFIFSQW